jgi:hypothetical protein
VTDLRASDADRERTVTALRHHALEGRLSVDELDERVEQAYSARTLRELAGLQSDLPVVRMPSARPPDRRRRAVMPGRWGFAVRWHSQADANETMTELMRHVAPPMVRQGYDITQRWDGRLRFERRVRPAWTIAVAILLLPLGGPLALLYKEHETVTIDLDESDDGTQLVATGIAPRPVRRAFLELEE